MDYQNVIEEQQKTEAEKLAEAYAVTEGNLFSRLESKEHQEWLKHPVTINVMKALEIAEDVLLRNAGVLAFECKMAQACNKIIEYKTINNIRNQLYARH